MVVFIYDGTSVRHSMSFSSRSEALDEVGRLDLQGKVKRVIVDDGKRIVYDLVRDRYGMLYPV